VDVLDAQSALLDSETNYYGALADVQVARAQIDLAIGEEKP
jgi:outer membrane protein TolC